MDHILLKRYADELRALKELENEVELLKTQVLAHLEAQQLDKVAIPEGTYSIVPVVRYEYPPEVEAKKLAYSDAKDHAVEDGTATATESKTLRFQAAKEKTV